MGRFLNRLFGPAPEVGQPIIARAGDEVVARDVEPLEGTNVSLWNDGNQIQSFWTENGLNEAGKQFWPGDGRLAERVWVANRCIQMNAQQIASMPLKFNGSTQPAWVSSPDPAWYPNGISDAIFSIVRQMYGWGYACLCVTDYYSDGYPRTWTVLDSSRLSIMIGPTGARVYRYGSSVLDASRVIQIDRNPGTGAHGTPALRALAQMSWGLIAAGNQSMALSEGAMPKVYFQPQRKQTAEQARKLQTQWMQAAQSRNGAPPVVPHDLNVNELSFNPSDLALLETQEFNAKAIMSAFGVPAVLHNMAIRWGMTYQNPAALGETWWRFELRPTAKRVADALTAQLLPSGQWVWFDAEDTFLPLATEKSGPFASDMNDDQAADDPQAFPPANAKASPGPKLTAIGGTG